MALNFDEARNNLLNTYGEQREPSGSEYGEQSEPSGSAEGEQSTPDETPSQAQAAEEAAQQQSLLDTEQAQAQAADAANVAQQAAMQNRQAQAQAQQQMMMFQQQIQQLAEQNKRLTDLITQQNSTQEQAIVEQMNEAPAPPVFDWEGIMYDDDNARQQKFEEFQAKRDEYLTNKIMSQLAPTLDYASKLQHRTERDDMIAQIKDIERFRGIDKMLPQIEHIMERNPEMYKGDMVDNYVNAYLVARGMEALDTPPKTFSAQELVDMVRNNPEAADLFEKQRIAALQNNQSVPAMSASSGAGNAALNNNERPKNFDEAKQNMLSKLFLGRN